MESSEANGQTVLQLDFAKLIAPFSVSAMKRRAAVSKRLSFETTVFITHSRLLRVRVQVAVWLSKMCIHSGSAPCTLGLGFSFNSGYLPFVLMPVRCR